MENRTKIIISVLSGLFAIVALLVYLNYQENRLLEMASPVYVVAAKKDILKHTQIDETMLKIIKVPKKYVQPGTIHSVQDALGQAASAPILKNEQIVSTKLLRFGRETGLAMKVPAGMRAISILVDDVTGVAGLIKPNNFVDMLTTFDFGDQTKSRQYTYTLFQNVQVLAVRSDMGEATSAMARQKEGALQNLLTQQIASQSKTVTLAVTPEQAQDIVLAQETGVITLSLRGIWESNQQLELEPSTTSGLTGLKNLLKQNMQPRYREYKGRR